LSPSDGQFPNLKIGLVVVRRQQRRAVVVVEGKPPLAVFLHDLDQVRIPGQVDNDSGAMWIRIPG
jgi:hypothetical protein